MSETFYSVLGVEQDAGREVIDAAYREAVKDCHPDVSDDPDAERRFKRLTTARDVLVDEGERARYDRLGHASYVQQYASTDLWAVERTAGTRDAQAGSGGSETRQTHHSSAPWWETYRSTDSTAQYESYARERQRRARAAGRHRQYGTSATGQGQRYTASASQHHRERDPNAAHRGRSDEATASATGSPGRNRGAGVSVDASAVGEAVDCRTGSHSRRDAAVADPWFDLSLSNVTTALVDVGPWMVVHVVFLATVLGSTVVTYHLWARPSTAPAFLLVSVFIFTLSTVLSMLHILSQTYA